MIPCQLLQLGVSPFSGGIICYTDGSKTNKGTAAGVYCYGTRRRLSFSLGQYTTVFQAEVYAKKARADENIDRNYKNRSIYILSDNQAAIQALDKYQITSKLAWTATNPSCNWPDITGFN
jgi:hypothetical protein